MGGNTKKRAQEGEAEEFEYQHPKPPAITTHLFMWEMVATFCPPKQVLELEHLCRDVHHALRVSSTGTGLLQCYWHCLSARLTWDTDHLVSQKTELDGGSRGVGGGEDNNDEDDDGVVKHRSPSSRHNNNGGSPTRAGSSTIAFSPSDFSRQQGKLCWKKIYEDQYTNWVESMRKFSGNLSRKPVVGELRLNPILTAKQLQQQQPPSSVPPAKKVNKKKVLKVEGVYGKNDHHHNLEKKKIRDKGDPPSTRDEYKYFSRCTDYQGKHKKGGRKTHEDFPDLE